METSLLREIDRKIADVTATLAALKAARAALQGGGAAPRATSTGRRTFTAAQRAEVSKRMKAMWAKRRRASKS